MKKNIKKKIKMKIENGKHKKEKKQKKQKETKNTRKELAKYLSYPSVIIKLNIIFPDAFEL